MRTAISLMVLMLGTGVVWAQEDSLRVVGVSPAANAVSAPADVPFIVDFDQPVDPATFEGTAVLLFGRWTGVRATDIQFEEGNTRVRLVPDRPFSAGEIVTISLAHTIATPDGHALDAGYTWQFWMQTRPASLDLEQTDVLSVRREGEGRVLTYGAYAGDLDADGDTDFLVPNEITHDVRVFMNNGAGTFDGDFEIYPLPNGERPSTNEGADFNRDGHLDFAVGSRGGNLVSVFMGDGTGTLIGPEDYTVELSVHGLTVLDLNADGFPDIATANRNGSTGSQNPGTVTTLLNNGDGTFRSGQIINTDAEGETSVAAVDMNEDGILDLVVSSLGQSGGSGDIVVLLGDGHGTLTPHTTMTAGGRVWMLAAGDVNGDGHVDVVATDVAAGGASVLYGDGTGGLSEPTIYESGELPFAIDLGDLDGDGDLDMVISNLGTGEIHEWWVYENDGGLFVNPRTYDAPQAASCAVLHDRDGDGALDMTGIDERADLLILFANTPQSTATESFPDAMPAMLLPGYPNPFHEQTTFTLRLDAPGPARLIVYDLLGRRVRTLLDAVASAGEHPIAWDGLDATGHRVTPGLYIVHLETDRGRYVQTTVRY